MKARQIVNETMMIVLERTYTETQIHSPRRSRNLQPPPICFKETRKQRYRKQNKQTKRERSEWMEGKRRLRKIKIFIFFFPRMKEKFYNIKIITSEIILISDSINYYTMYYASKSNFSLSFLPIPKNILPITVRAP